MGGLVLSGGGAKGAYQVGVVKALDELGYDYQCITGTSIGALNGAFIAAGQLDNLYELWSKLELSDVLAGNTELLERVLKLDIKTQDFNQMMRSIKGLVDNNGFDLSPFKALLYENLKEEWIRESPMDLGIVTVSLTDFKPIEVFKSQIPEGMLLDYLIASANLPVFKIQPLEGKLFIDGGFYDNLPINLMASKGIKDIVAVDLGAIGITRKTQADDLNIRTIRPSEDVGLLLEITPVKAKYNLKMGYYDTMKSFGRFIGRLYYISNDKEKGQVLNQLWNSALDLEPFELFLPTKGMDQKRALFEKILPFYADLFKLESSADHEAICVGILEESAAQLDIERMRVYTYRELALKIEAASRRKSLDIRADQAPLHSVAWSSLLMTKKQKKTLVLMGWDLVKGVFLDEGI